MKMHKVKEESTGFRINYPKTKNKSELISGLKLLDAKKKVKETKQVKNPVFIPIKPEKVVIDVKSLEPNRELQELVAKASERYEPQRFSGRHDAQFEDRIMRPFSDLCLHKPVVEEICKGSSYHNKIDMFGIVEATFGGQSGYLHRLVKKELVHYDEKKGMAREREAMQEYRVKGEELRKERWLKMYK